MDPETPTRDVELIISEVNVLSLCCFCGTKDGVIRCSQCKAVHEISQKIQETRAEIDVFNSPEVLLMELDVLGTEVAEPYVKARWSLAEAYAKCGEETSSRLAFRLAVENFLDLLYFVPLRMDVYFLQGCSWMVAGDMDQLALNLICYFVRRGRIPRRFPYLEMSNEDIEGASCITDVQEKTFRSYVRQTSEMCFQTIMLISLIKFKRLQALLVEGRKEDARWNAFMEGTHPETGESSEVLRLAGEVLVREKIRELFVDQSTNKRVALLTKQINGLLETVNERNPKLIPGIIDRQTLEHPASPDWDQEKFFVDLYFGCGPTEQHLLDSARYAANISGHVWHMDKEYTRALKLFLDTGNVMAEEENAGHVKGEEEDTGNVKAEEEDTGNVMAEEEDTGNVMSEEEDAGHVKGEEEDTGNVMAKEENAGHLMAEEEDTGNVMAKEENAGHVKAEEEDTGNVMAVEKDVGKCDGQI